MVGAMKIFNNFAMDFKLNLNGDSLFLHQDIKEDRPDKKN